VRDRGKLRSAGNCSAIITAAVSQASLLNSLRKPEITIVIDEKRVPRSEGGKGILYSLRPRVRRSDFFN